MKRIRTSYSYKVSPEDEQAKIYLDAIVKRKEIEQQLIDATREIQRAKQELIALIKRSPTRTATADLIEFTLSESDQLIERLKY